MSIVLDDNNFKKETSSGVVLVDFYADWCGPCIMIGPILNSVSDELETGKLVKVDVDESPITAEEFQIRSIPTIVVLKDGEEQERHVGANSDKEFYFDLVKKYL